MGERSEQAVLIYEAVTGGGIGPGALPPSLAREGAAIRRALVADFAAVPGVRVVEPVDARSGGDRPAASNVDRIIVDPARPIDLGTLIRAADAAVIVAPETAGELARLADLVARGAGRSLGATPAAIRLCSAKQALADHFDRLGIPTPPTRTVAARAGLPSIASPSGLVVIKPVDGAGSVATFVLGADRPSSPEGWPASPALIQPYRPGPSLSASFLVGRDGRAHLIAVGRQEIAIDAGGRVTYAGGELPIPTAEVDLAPVRRAVESVPGLRGFVGVDFIAVEPTGLVEVIEINPRVTTSIVGLVRLAPPGTIARAWLDCLMPTDLIVVPQDRPSVDGCHGFGTPTPCERSPSLPGPPIAERRGSGSGYRTRGTPIDSGTGRLDPTPADDIPGPAFAALRAALPVRFGADGSILPPVRANP